MPSAWSKREMGKERVLFQTEGMKEGIGEETRMEERRARRERKVWTGKARKYS